jgi:DNA-binding NarL/FixJ family response regulator
MTTNEIDRIIPMMYSGSLSRKDVAAKLGMNYRTLNGRVSRFHQHVGRLMLSGMPLREIAKELNCSVVTVQLVRDHRDGI